MTENQKDRSKRNVVHYDGLSALPPLPKPLQGVYPLFFARTAVGKLFPGVISSGHLSVLDSRGEGPPRFMVGSKTCYATADFLKWLESRMR